jgi:NAD(P)-dependent dehydrogenase (short-subunit alcohol dehydrogenase family)
MNPTRFDLTGRVALVSGSASGLGRAMANAFAEHGADVVLADRNGAGLEATAAEIARLGRRAVPVVCDVSDPDAIRALFARLDAEFGRIDVLGNVAGDAVLDRPEDITIDAVKQVLQTLVVGRFCMCQEAGRRMLQAGRGSIINIGSLASITALGRGHIAYSMAMGAVAQMTRELSTEWSGHGVRVNAILPAQVVNPSLRDRMAADATLEARWLRGIPRGRLGQPEDIQGLAVLLASDAAAWITGALIPMDGGNLALNGGGTVRHATNIYPPVMTRGARRARTEWTFHDRERRAARASYCTIPRSRGIALGVITGG